ncbi:MAG: hypothetical protein U1E88_04770 [Acinetobacter sp.]
MSVTDGVANPDMVTYLTGSNKTILTLAGAGGTTINNVKAGVAATDAVNKGQMDSAISTAIAG